MAFSDGDDAAVVIALHEIAAQVLGQAPDRCRAALALQAPDAAPGEVTDDSAVAVEGLFAVVEEPAGDQRRNTALLESLNVTQARELEELYASPLVLQRAGLLSRIEALHQYTLSNRVAFAAWVLFFTLMLFFELMVVLVKLVFGTTVDDQIEAIRERISHEKATAYLAAVSSPVGRARQLADASYV